MILERTNENINKAEDARMMDAQIGFADALQRVPSDDGGALGNGFIEAMQSALMC